MLIGQQKVQAEANLLVEEIKRGRNLNIALFAPSGFGKTTLAYSIMHRIGYEYCQVSVPEEFLFDDSRRVHFFDEVHLLEPQESIYPFMDSGKYTFILATNESGNLKEALVRRCIPLIFDTYSEYELLQIANMYLASYNLSEDMLSVLVEKSSSNPGRIVNMSVRLDIYFKNKGVPDTAEELHDIFFNYLNIDREGFNAYERKYVNFLRTIGGKASLTLIANSTRIDRNTILRDIEPSLITRGMLRITNQGRELYDRRRDFIDI